MVTEGQFGELTEAQSAALDTLLGGESGFVSFGCSSGKGFYYVCSGAVADRKIGESKSEAENTTVPVTEPPAESTEKPGTAKDTKGTDAPPTSAPATEKPSDGGNGGGNTVIYIVAGAVIVIAAAVIIVSLVKKKKK